MKSSDSELNEAWLKVLDQDYKDSNSEEIKYVADWCYDRVEEGKYKDTNTAWVSYEGYPDSVLFMVEQLDVDIVELLGELVERRIKEEEEAVKEHLDLMNDMRGTK